MKMSVAINDDKSRTFLFSCNVHQSSWSVSSWSVERNSQQDK